MTKLKTWKKIAYKIGVWLAAEVWLNLIGLDNIADYSEFIFAQELELNLKNRRTVKVTEYPPHFCPQIDEFCPLPGTATLPSNLANSERTKTFKKCQNLAKPCLKVVCLSSIDSSAFIDSRK